jgi:hypothetical protein
MKFIFENEDESQTMWNSAHESILYWKKVLQDAQGKICLQVDGTPTHYSVEEATEKMVENAKVLKMVEDAQGVEYYSGIITKTLKKEVAS